MRTIVHLNDGTVKTFDGAAPAVTPTLEQTESLLDVVREDGEAIVEFFQLSAVSRVEFVVDTTPVGPGDARD